MMAKDNSGAAAIAVKINADGTDLSLSDYYYQRFPNDSLAALSTALSQMPNIWDYSAKEQ